MKSVLTGKLRQRCLFGAGVASGVLAVSAWGENTAPQLTANSGLDITQNEEVVITTSMLDATDLDAQGFASESADIFFVIGLSEQPSVVQFGKLLIRDIVTQREVQPLESITLQDIEDGIVSYRAEVADGLNDGFVFQVKDVEGLLAGDGEFTMFTFPIRITQVNTAPIAGNGALEVGLGEVSESTLPATDNDLPAQELTYSIVDPAPNKGSVELLDATAGTYRYTPDPGASGEDVITFQVSDGELQSESAGTVTIAMVNRAPVLVDMRVTALGNGASYGFIEVEDEDLPAQDMTFTVVTEPQRGQVIVRDSGYFQYIPSPGRFGEDGFEVMVNDGIDDSNTVTVRVDIQRRPVLGDILMASKFRDGDDGNSATVAMLDPDQGDFVGISSEGLLANVLTLAYSKWSGKAYVAEGEPGSGVRIVEIDLVSGDQRVLVSDPLVFVLGLTASDDGYLYLGNVALPGGEVTTGNIYRVDLRDDSLTELDIEGINSPTGLAIDEEGSLIVLDAEDLSLFSGNMDADATVLKIDLETENVSVLASGENLHDPIGILPLDGGELLVSEIGGDIVKISATGEQSLVYEASEGEPTITGLTMDENGNIYGIGAVLNDATPSIIKVNSVDPPDVSTLASGDFLGEPFGFAAITQYENYDTWVLAYFPDYSASAGGVNAWDDAADPDGDGIPNLLEFALSLNPLSAENPDALIERYLKWDDDGGVMSFAFGRRMSETGLDYALDVSGDMDNWTTIDATEETSTNGTTIVLEDTVNVSGNEPRFVRLTVSRR